MSAPSHRAARAIAVGALVLWGIVHVVGGLAEVMTVERDGGTAALELLGSSATAGEIGTDPGAVAESVIAFHGFLIASAGAAVIALTTAYTMRRRPPAVRGALAIVAIADLGLVLFLVLPGYTPITEAFWGPVLLVVAIAGAVRGQMIEPDGADERTFASR